MKRLIYYLSIGLVVSVHIDSYSQNGTDSSQPVKCYSAEYLQRQIQANPSLQADIDAENKKFSDLSNLPQLYSADTSIITIPVVFHVVYNTNEQNIPDLRLMEQLQVFNEDFNAANKDLSGVPSAFKKFIGNTHLQFCLAQRDPANNPTTGITRTFSADTMFYMDDNVKYTSSGGCDIWDRTKYLNIWVCNLSGPVLGYTTLPYPAPSASVDGSVVCYKYVGLTGSVAPYNLGHSISHEVGHWFNLIHTWGDANCGNDLVNDTPVQQGPNYGTNGNCPAFPHVTCGNGPNGDMWMNFMDYGYDHCAYFFTAGQCTRMRTAITSYRPQIKLSKGCSPLGIDEQTNVIDFSIYPNPANEQLTVNLSLRHTENIRVNLYNMMGECVLNTSLEAFSGGVVNLDLGTVSSGIYSLELITSESTLYKKVVKK